MERFFRCHSRVGHVGGIVYLVLNGNIVYDRYCSGLIVLFEDFNSHNDDRFDDEKDNRIVMMTSLPPIILE